MELTSRSSLHILAASPMPIASGGLVRRWQAVAFALVFLGPALPAAAQSVLTYHGRPDRSGNYAMPEFTWEHARGLRLDPGFAPRSLGSGNLLIGSRHLLNAELPAEL